MTHTHQQRRILDYLKGNGEVSQAQLARALQMSVKSVHRHLRPLLEQGEVLLEQDRGRSSRVRLAGES